MKTVIRCGSSHSSTLAWIAAPVRVEVSGYRPLARPLPSPSSNPCARITSENTVIATVRAPNSSRSSSRVVFAIADDAIEVEVKIEGMMCGGCTSRVEEALKKMDCVRNVSVNLESKLATIELKADSQLAALDLMPSLVQAIKDLGFEAQLHF